MVAEMLKTFKHVDFLVDVFGIQGFDQRSTYSVMSSAKLEEFSET